MKHLSHFALCLYTMILLVFFVSETRLTSLPYFMTKINLIPFAQLYDYIQLLWIHAINPNIVLRNTIGEIIFVMPFGILLPASFKNITLTKGLFITVLLGVLYSLIKYFTYLGSFDIDDLIYYVIGFTVGYSILHVHKTRSLS